MENINMAVAPGTLTPGQSFSAADNTEAKRFATTQAQFALHGWALQKLTSPNNGTVSYVLSIWGQSRAFSNFDDLSAFLDLIGGAS